MATLLRDEFHIVVTESGTGIWEWEICRQGEPLAVPMRDGPFGSEKVALAAGKIALREFLELLESEQESDDPQTRQVRGSTESIPSPQTA